MKALFCSLVVGLLVSVSGFSQYQIQLKPEVFSTDTSLFYVQKVVDSSANQLLGIVNNQELFLKPSLAQGVSLFLEKSLPVRNDAMPIVLIIQEVSIQKAQTDVSHVTARVFLNLTFTDTANTVLFQISHSEDEVFDEFSENAILHTHEKRIRAGLEYCMRSFQRQLQQPNLNWREDFERSQTSDFHLPRWHNMLTYKKVQSNHTEGWRISYTGFADRTDDFILPFVFSFDQVRLKPDLLINGKIKSVNTFALGMGFNGYLKIIKGFYVGVGLGVPIGVEFIRDIENRKKTNFLIGVDTKQGVLIMPWQELGIVMGFNLFQTFQTSKVYQTNYGFEWEIGINF